MQKERSDGSRAAEAEHRAVLMTLYSTGIRRGEARRTGAAKPLTR
jgi:hypothetical protein